VDLARGGSERDERKVDTPRPSKYAYASSTWGLDTWHEQRAVRSPTTSHYVALQKSSDINAPSGMVESVAPA